jgi:hypothetical protein
MALDAGSIGSNWPFERAVAKLTARPPGLGKTKRIGGLRRRCRLYGRLDAEARRVNLGDAMEYSALDASKKVLRGKTSARSRLACALAAAERVGGVTVARDGTVVSRASELVPRGVAWLISQ